MLNETDTTTGTDPRWWIEAYTAVPDPIEADTDYTFDTSAEAAEHGTPWAVLENPDAYTHGPVTPRPLHHRRPPPRRGLLPRLPRAPPRRGPRHLVPLLLNPAPCPHPRHPPASTGGSTP